MILANRLLFACRTNKLNFKLMWTSGSGDKIILGSSRYFPVLLCKQCALNITRTVQTQSYFKCSSLSKSILNSVRPVLRCVRRGNQTNTGLSKPSLKVKRELKKPSKISNQEFRRLLGLAKPERWKLTGT